MQLGRLSSRFPISVTFVFTEQRIYQAELDRNFAIHGSSSAQPCHHCAATRSINVSILSSLIAASATAACLNGLCAQVCSCSATDLRLRAALTARSNDTSRCRLQAVGAFMAGRRRGPGRSSPKFPEELYTDPAKVGAIDHRGKYFTVPGAHLSSPRGSGWLDDSQSHLLISSADASEQGMRSRSRRRYQFSCKFA